MTTYLKPKLVVLLTTAAVAFVPAAAFGSSNARRPDRHTHRPVARYVLGDNWKTIKHRHHRRHTALSPLELIVSRSI